MHQFRDANQSKKNTQKFVRRDDDCWWHPTEQQECSEEQDIRQQVENAVKEVYQGCPASQGTLLHCVAGAMLIDWINFVELVSV